jgi:hypothetical protein
MLNYLDRQNYMLKLEIVIDIFSGRKNPAIELEGDEAAETLERLKPSRKLKKDDLGLPPSSTLGYRGLIIKQKGNKSKDLPTSFRLVNGDLFGPRLSHRATDENYEDFFCSTKGLIRKIDLGKNFPRFVRKEIKRFHQLREEYKVKPIHWPSRILCECAPLYEPQWWNDGGQKQLNNNCYNYSTNYRTDTFAQPGQAAGIDISNSYYCPTVRPAAAADDLIDTPNAHNKGPKEGHLVALVVAPGIDYHWYRKGRNGHWTHKPGSTPVTNLDNSGVTISDPRTANRGPYTDFCTFMVVMHGHIKIS